MYLIFSNGRGFHFSLNRVPQRADVLVAVRPIPAIVLSMVNPCGDPTGCW